MRYLVFLLFTIIPTKSAEHYVLAHMHNPDVVNAFINNLDKKDKLFYQAQLALMERDFYKANSFFHELAKLNDPNGYRGLADSYISGQGFAKNLQLALIFYEKAAYLGLGPAQVNAASMCADLGDHKRSKFWFKKALANKEMAFMWDEIHRIQQRKLAIKE